MIAPFLAVLAGAAGMVVDKIAISKRGIQLRYFIPFLFLYLFFFTALTTPFLGSVNWFLLLSPEFLLLFLVLISLAVTWNIFYYESLQKETLAEFESILMMAPLVTVALSWVFFPETWDMRVGIAALVGTSALVWSHWEKHHLALSHYSLNLIVAVVLMATEDIIATEFLRDGVFSPVSLYAIRTFVLFAFFFAYYRPNIKRMNKSQLNIISLAGLMGAAYMVFRYYGFKQLGVPYTVLVTVAAPMAIYMASATVLHERMKVKVLASAAIIAGTIVYATAVLYK